MEVIKCPVCGNEKCKEVSDDKYICLACDNVFLIHNLSKEFKETDQHLTAVHEDIKKAIEEQKNNKASELILHAEKLMSIKKYDEAEEIYEKVTEEAPNSYVGWYGRERAFLEDFTYRGNLGEDSIQDIIDDVNIAVKCSDCDEEFVTSSFKNYFTDMYSEWKNEKVGDIEMLEEELEVNALQKDKKIAPIVIGIIGCIIGFFLFKHTAFKMGYTYEIMFNVALEDVGFFAVIGNMFVTLVWIILSIIFLIVFFYIMHDVLTINKYTYNRIKSELVEEKVLLERWQSRIDIIEEKGILEFFKNVDVKQDYIVYYGKETNKEDNENEEEENETDSHDLGNAVSN